MLSIMNVKYQMIAFDAEYEANHQDLWTIAL